MPPTCPATLTAPLFHATRAYWFHYSYFEEIGQRGSRHVDLHSLKLSALQCNPLIMTSSLPLDDWAEQVQYQGHYLLPIDLGQATGTWRFVDADRN